MTLAPDHVQRPQERVVRWGQLHGRDVCRGLGEEDAFLLDIGIALAETDLLPTASTKGHQHLSGLGSAADVHRLPADQLVVRQGL